MIYVGYQGVGKSTLAGKDNFIDLESSNFWIDTSGVGVYSRPNGWEQIYVNIAKHLSDQGYNVFLSSHKQIREYMNANNIEFIVIYPELIIKDAWINKLKLRYEQSKSDKDNKALMAAEKFYDDNINDLSKEKNKIVITNFNYNLKDLICG